MPTPRPRRADIPDAPRGALAPQLRALVLLRLGVLAVVLLLVLFSGLAGFQGVEGPEAPVEDIVRGSALTGAGFFLAGILLVAALAADACFALALRFPWGGGRGAATVQVVTDVLLVTLLVYATHGSAASPLAVLYFGPVVAAALLLPLPLAVAVALGSVGGLAVIDAVYVAASTSGAVLPWIGDTAPTSLTWTTSGIVSLLAYGAAFLGVTFLGGTLGRRLTRAELLLDEVLHSLNEGVVAVDADGRVAFSNDEARRLLGMPPEMQASDRPVAEVAGEAAGALLPLLQAERSSTTLLELGAGVPIEVHAAVVRDDGGHRRGTVFVLRDVSLRREVARARAQAERLREVSEMSAGLAHEIRNPLASVRGAIQALMEGIAATTEVRRLMELAVTESDRLDGIITQFLDFAAMRGPRQSWQPAGQLFDEVTLLLKARDLPEGIAVQTEVRNGLRVWADGDQLRQVVLNLALNGVEAMRAGGGTLTFAARPADRGGVQLQVSDTGVGVPQQDLPKLGTPFFSGRPQGTGLGLAVVERIVGAHGGTMRIESTAGVGTTVTCTLPDEEVAA